jgi:hypothetical protein
MKEQDLRRCFAKIKPSESLVSDTIRRIGEAEEKRSARSSFRFSYRLASAVCALVLVLGLGVAVLYNPMMIPKSYETESASPMSLVSGRNVNEGAATEPNVTPDSATLSRMTSDAEKSGGDYAVFFGNLDGCYFGGVKVEDAERGVIYHCTLTFTVDSSTLSCTDDSVAEDGLIQADVYVFDTDTMDMITNSAAGRVYVRLANEHGEWVVEELIPYTEK